MRTRLDILNVEILNEKDMQIVKELQSHYQATKSETVRRALRDQHETLRRNKGVLDGPDKP
jgi:hypothetical protein